MKGAALILAGTRRGGDGFARHMGVAHKALIDVGGVTMLERVASALKQAGFAQVAISCDEPSIGDLAKNLGLIVLPSQAAPSHSVEAALELLDAPLFVTTSDHALLRPEWIEQAIADTPERADLSVLMARREQVEAVLPGTQRTYLKFNDGEWSGCNMFYLQTRNSRAALQLWQQVESNRKRPIRLVHGLGIGTLFSYVLGRLSLAEGIAKLGKRVGVEAALVPAEDGLAAVDVDKLADLESVLAIVAEDAASGR